MIFFRNDDVNPNTDHIQIEECYKIFEELFPGCQIISCITLFGRSNNKGSIYKETPFKNNPVNWFYNVDRFMLEWHYINLGMVASHGLFHVEHSKLDRQSQEMSILSSCNFLDTKIFVPPFNKWNSDTVNICSANDIRILSSENKWKSFEFEPFDSTHKYWYFHSWRFTPERLREVLISGKHSKTNG